LEVPGKKRSHVPPNSLVVTIILLVAAPGPIFEKSPQSPAVTDPNLVLVVAFKPSRLGKRLLVSGLKKLFLAYATFILSILCIRLISLSNNLFSLL
jgi:hypothetical protein